MTDLQADDNGDPQVPDSRDADLLLRVIDVVSARLVGSQPDAIATEIANHLGSLPLVEATGVWFAPAGDGPLLARAWHSSLLDERDARVRQTAESLANERLEDASPFQRIAEGEANRSRVFVGLPLYRARTLGMIVLYCRRRLDAPELAALAILARQAAAEIHGSSSSAGAGGTLQASASADRIGNTQFVALVAHELRTPLTALRGNVQLAGMAMRKGDLERVDARLNAALKGVDGISALVQNLQDMSHLERGKFQLARVKGDLAVTVRNAAKRAERLIESDQHTITVETPDEAESYFDPARIEQAVFNILVNALQYSPNGGTVIVHVECGDQEAIVTVKDQGVGIPPEEQQKVFAPYYRGSLAKTTNAKGLGLGLTISQATAERHGGSIGIESTPGSGSTISLRLPLAASEVQAKTLST